MVALYHTYGCTDSACRTLDTITSYKPPPCHTKMHTNVSVIDNAT